MIGQRASKRSIGSAPHLQRRLSRSLSTLVSRPCSMHGRSSATCSALALIPAASRTSWTTRSPLTSTSITWRLLLGKYNRLLALKIRRTDPPAGSRVETPHHAVDVPITTAVSSIRTELLALSDVRMVEASLGAPTDPPCAQPFPSEGTHISIEADLEPDANYDLLLVAPPMSTPLSDDIMIARTNFHTSRYRKPADMMTALGFPVGAINSYPSEELIVNAAMPTSTVLADDRMFDEVLTMLGLDPWPIAKRPRTTVLWQIAGSTWAVTGVLLETHEALERGERMGDIRMKIGTQTLTPIRSNAATTRILLAPPAPLPIDADQTLVLIVRDGTTDITGERGFVMNQPVAVMEVG